MEVVVTIQIVLWVGSAWLFFLNSKLKSWVRVLYAISVFPLLEVLVVLNVILTGRLAPELLELVNRLVSENWPSKIVAPVAFVATASIAVVVFLIWVRFLEFLDKKMMNP